MNHDPMYYVFWVVAAASVVQIVMLYLYWRWSWRGMFTAGLLSLLCGIAALVLTYSESGL